MGGKSFAGAMPGNSKVNSSIVLLGGGHSHVQVIKKWAMHPLPGVELILVSAGAGAPYSGMLPGRLAGWYTDEEMHFNLPAICARAGVAFIDDRVMAIDPVRREVHLAGRAPLAYDIASLNVGIEPEVPPGAGGHPRVMRVKPIGTLLAQWEQLWRDQPEGDWLIVGGGAAGFELAVIAALKCRERGVKIRLHLLDSGERVLSAHGARVAARAESLLAEMGVQVHHRARIARFAGDQAMAEDGREFSFSQALLATGAGAPAWFAASGLPVDERGFVRVDDQLRVEGFADLFAAGDCIHFSAQPLPKSGVFAVREGPVLFENLVRAVKKQKLKTYRPQRRTLALITSGEKRALLSYGGVALEGEWLWRWKDRIDRRFMERFGVAEAPSGAMEINTCGGCGGKLGAREVGQVVERLKAQAAFTPLLPARVEDAGWIETNALSVDGFRTFTGDLHWLGEVAVHHALNDLYASGAGPAGATIFAGLPAAVPARRSAQLLQLMTGVLQALGGHGAKLINAHSAESAETMIVVTALGTGPGPVSKSGARVGDVLILSKALGTGAVLQGLMQGRISIPGWSELKAVLGQHHGLVAPLTREFVSAGTDISGFGLLGHLNEMLEGTGVAAELDVARIPSMREFSRMDRLGVRAFLTAGNRADFGSRVEGALSAADWHLLCDPQTHGPLLFCVGAEAADRVLSLLHDNGFAQAAVIGRIRAGEGIFV